MAGILLTTIIVVIVGIVIAWYYQDGVNQLLVTEINKHVRTEIRVNDISFSVLRRFPRASVEFKDVLIKVPAGYDHSELQDPGNDTLFTAQSLFLHFNIKDIFKSDYRINSIYAREGVLNLAVNSGLQENYRFWKSSDSSSDGLDIDLQDVRLRNYKLAYTNIPKEIHMGTELKELEMKGNFSRSSYKLKGSVLGNNSHLRRQDLYYSSDRDLLVNVSLNVSNELVSIQEGSIELAGIKVFAKGEYQNGEQGNIINMDFIGYDLDISSFVLLLPDRTREALKNYQFGGKLDIEFSVTGNLTKSLSPSVIVSFRTENGDITRKDTGMNLNRINLSGYYNNGSLRSPQSSFIVFENFSSDFGQGKLQGEGRITNLSVPAIDFSIDATFMLEELAGFYKPGQIVQMAGQTSTSFTVNGYLGKLAIPDIRELNRMNLSGILEIRNGMIEISGRKHIASEIDGELHFGKTLRTPGLDFMMGEDHFSLSGEIENGLPWLLGDDETMGVSGRLYSSNLNLDNYFYPVSQNNSQIPEAKDHLLFPDNLEMDLDFIVDDLSFRAFNSDRFSGRLSYKPRMMVLNALEFSSMKGTVSGNGVIVQRLNGDYTIQSQLQMSNLDMQTMFLSFNNFGQSFIHGDNLRGSLTGDLSIISEWDRDFKLKNDKIIADSRIEIEEGELVDFEPMLGLARFIDVAELSHIRFSKLTNEIFIKDQVVTIPYMDINSSAFDVSGSGKHRFDGQFDYRLRVLLSDVLYGRAGRSKPENREFGIIEDDGLGRTSLYLLISGTTADYRVSYDHRAVRDVIRDNIANERNVLRQLFHEEFGWFSADTANSSIPADPGTSRPGFRITWEEEDQGLEPGEQPAPSREPDNQPRKKKFEIIWDEEKQPGNQGEENQKPK